MSEIREIKFQHKILELLTFKPIYNLLLLHISVDITLASCIVGGKAILLI